MTTRQRRERLATGLAFVIAAIVIGAPASAGVTAIGPGDFGSDSTIITFDELAVGTSIPFTIGIAEFAGLFGSISDVPLGDAIPPAPSGAPYLSTGTLDDEDVIEVLLGSPQESVGAYFDIAGAGLLVGNVQLEFYSGATLLGTLAAVPDAGTTGGFVGGSAGSAIIDRVIFRDIDPAFGVSFRIDDFTFAVPAPATVLPMLLAGFAVRRRH
jgi:hypothetical protein